MVERVDLLSYKEKLQLVLKDDTPKYWDCLLQFIQGKNLFLFYFLRT